MVTNRCIHRTVLRTSTFQHMCDTYEGTCVYEYTCNCMCICVYVYMCICTCIYIYIEDMYAHIFICVRYIHTYIHTYIYIYIYIYIICTYIHIHVYNVMQYPSRKEATQRSSARIKPGSSSDVKLIDFGLATFSKAWDKQKKWKWDGYCSTEDNQTISDEIMGIDITWTCGPYNY